MSDGLINSFINPGMRTRGSGLAQRGDVAAAPPRALEGQLMDSQQQRGSELPVAMNRSGPRSEQAMSQYQTFAGTGAQPAGAGFSAVV